MSFDAFSFDYGILPSEYAKNQYLTNPCELLDCMEWERVLRFCRIDEARFSSLASDYDRFCAMCTALPLLIGHPLRAWVLKLLREHFQIIDEVCEQTADALWRTISQKLLEHPMRFEELIEEGCTYLCDQAIPPSALLRDAYPMLLSNVLLNGTFESRLQWRGEIERTLSAYREAGCRQLLLRFSAEGEFIAPDVYHVEKALRATTRSAAQKQLLSIQLMRELCELCPKMDLTLILEGDSCAKTTVKLLQYAEQTVGLPKICWVCNDCRHADAMLAFIAEKHDSPMYLALRMDEVLTDAEFLDAMYSVGARYPVGHVSFITACDLRMMPFLQKDLKNRMQVWMKQVENIEKSEKTSYNRGEGMI